MIPVLLYSVVYLMLFAFADLLYHQFRIPAEKTRKFVHIISGLISLTFPIYFSETWQVAVICTSFILLLAMSEKMHWFPSITAVKRKSWGSWLFPLSILLCFIAMKQFQNSQYYYIPMLILTISDTVASLVGQRFPIATYHIFGHQKSLGGSSAFFVTACIIYWAFLSQEISLISILMMAVMVTIVEGISHKGVDNLTIPMAVICSLLIFGI